MGKSYLDDLNERQQKAVCCTDGPVMIIAGAGSGKTRTLTYRVAHLLHCGVDPFRIMALTFTNKAAGEMKNRIIGLAGDQARNLWMGTFHSVFSRLLRANADRLSYPSHFTIYDTEDSKNLVKTIVKELELSEKVYHPAVILSRISAAKNNLITWQDYATSQELLHYDQQTNRPMLARIFEIYCKRCFQSAAMDFDDLLYNTYLLLDRFPDLLYKYQNQFSYLMVDEFQDTNRLQYLIVKRLAARHENICVVGDDAQSIYAFRGATLENMLTFRKDYPDVKIFKLEQNYRSTVTLVNAANSIIRNNKNQLSKEIWTANETGQKIKLLSAITDVDEGNIIADLIYNERMTHGFRYSDVAVLYRTHAQSRAIEDAFRRKGLPYKVYGALSFYARKEIKDLLAYFRLVVNLHDEEALRRIINYPSRGIGPTTMERLEEAAAHAGVTLWEVMENLSAYPTEISTPIRQRIAAFVAMIKGFHDRLHQVQAYDLAYDIAQDSGLLNELHSDQTPEGISRQENIQELLNVILEFTETGQSVLPTPPDKEEENELRTLDVFLRDVALLTNADEQDPENADHVSLMTVHMAKGLEFKQVFVAGMEENLFPSLHSLNSMDELEEERRLFYVAVTRAEKKLYLSYASSRYRWGSLMLSEPSRFLKEIDPACIEMPSELAWQCGGEAGRLQTDGRQSDFHSSQNLSFRNLNPLTSYQPGRSFTADDPQHISVGMEVFHARFGKGKVISVEGHWPDTRALVYFSDHGNKKLLLKFARLKIL